MGIDISLKKLMGVGAKKGGESKESIKLDVSENHFSSFFIQLLQVTDSGGSKYVHEFPDTRSFKTEPRSLPVVGGLELLLSANPGNKAEGWCTALESRSPWLSLCSVSWIICSGQVA